MNYNSKTLGHFFKFSSCVLGESLKIYYGLLSFQNLTWYLSLGVNPLNPKIIIQILLTGLHGFHWLLIGRTCLNIKTIYLWWSLAEFSRPIRVIIHWSGICGRRATLWRCHCKFQFIYLFIYLYDEEKFDGDHYWGFKGLIMCNKFSTV